MQSKVYIKIMFDGEDLSGYFTDTFAALKWLQFDHLKGQVSKLTGKKLSIKAV